MRMFLCLVICVLLLSGCGMQKKPDAETKDHSAQESVPENLGDPNAPVEVRALQGAKRVQQKSKEQQKADSDVLKEADH
jgi:hypothetical protein